MFSEKTKRAINKALKLMEEESPQYYVGEAITSSEAMKLLIELKLKHQKNEQFLVVFLDSQHRQIACEVLFKGTINASAVYPRVIIQKIFEHNAAAIVLGHNHPSGVSKPSMADRNITNRIVEVCKGIDVKVLDHIIVAKPSYSFAEHGEML